MDGHIYVVGGADEGTPFETYLESWLNGWSARRSILESVLGLISSPVTDERVPGFDRACVPARFLLMRGMGGIRLDSDGRLPPTTVDELIESEPCWGADDPCRQLHHLYDVLATGALLYRERGVAKTSESAPVLLEDDPDTLVVMSACWLVAGEGFNTDVAELGAALILAGHSPQPIELAAKVHPAIAEYWTEHGAEITLDQVHGSLCSWLAKTAAVGVIPDSWASELRGDDGEWPGPVGAVARACLTAMLRYRTLRHIPRGGRGWTTVGIGN